MSPAKKTPPPEADRSIYAYASLVFGLLSLLAAYLTMVLLGGIMGLSGLVYAFVGRDSRRRVVGQAGAVVSLLGLLATLLAAGII